MPGEGIGTWSMRPSDIETVSRQEAISPRKQRLYAGSRYRMVPIMSPTLGGSESSTACRRAPVETRLAASVPRTQHATVRGGEAVARQSGRESPPPGVIADQGVSGAVATAAAVQRQCSIGDDSAAARSTVGREERQEAAGSGRRAAGVGSGGVVRTSSPLSLGMLAATTDAIMLRNSPSSKVRGAACKRNRTEEMMQLCLIHLRLISLVAPANKGVGFS